MIFNKLNSVKERLAEMKELLLVHCLLCLYSQSQASWSTLDPSKVCFNSHLCKMSSNTRIVKEEQHVAFF